EPGSVHPDGRLLIDTVLGPVVTFAIEYAPEVFVVPVKPPVLTVTRTPLRLPRCGELTVPATVPVGAGPELWRSAATMILAEKFETVGSISKPTVWVVVVAPEAIGAAYASYR